MLACDLIMEVRASRALRAAQVARLERIVFGGPEIGRDQLQLVELIGRYAKRTDPSWTAFLARVARTLDARPSAPAQNGCVAEAALSRAA
jgi:hypothetical protein